MPGRLPFLIKEKIAYYKVIHFRTHETTVRVFWSAYYRLASHVEARIHQQRTSGLPVKCCDQSPVAFVGLFVDRLKITYLGNLGLYTDEQIVYGDSIQQGSKAQIPTYIISKDSKISTIFKLYRSEAGWKIYDAEVQGVSIILSFRSQFDQVLKNGTFEDLLMKLEQQAEESNKQIDVEDNPIMK